MVIILAKNNLITAPIVNPKEIDPVACNVITQLGRRLKTKARNQSVPQSYQPANPSRLTHKNMGGEALGVTSRVVRQIDCECVGEARLGVKRLKHRPLRQINSSNAHHRCSARTEWKLRDGLQ